MSTDQGLKSITIQLIDAIELVNNYNISISIVDNFKYKEYILNKIIVYYPRVVKVDISKLLIQSIDHAYNVQILERNIEVKWVKYNYENQILVISNYTKNDYGTHNLSITIFDDWYLRYFNSTLKVTISQPHPPVAVGLIPNITAYRGQDKIVVNIAQGIFLDKDENFSLMVTGWSNTDINTRDSINNFRDMNPLVQLEALLNSKFVGNCTSNIIAYDSYLQTWLVNFNINILQWTQANCLYWNGPNISDWIQWFSGFIIDSTTGEWRLFEYNYDLIIIIIYVTIVS